MNFVKTITIIVKFKLNLSNSNIQVSWFWYCDCLKTNYFLNNHANVKWWMTITFGSWNNCFFCEIWVTEEGVNVSGEFLSICSKHWKLFILRLFIQSFVIFCECQVNPSNGTIACALHFEKIIIWIASEVRWRKKERDKF